MKNLPTGYKTYVTAAAMVILSGLKAQGYIDENMYQLLMGVGVSLAAAFIRHGVTTETKKAVQDATIVPSPKVDVSSKTVVTSTQPTK